MPIFRFPFFYHPNYYNNRLPSSKFGNFTDNGNMASYASHNQGSNSNDSAEHVPNHFSYEEKKNNPKSNSKDEDNYFFELFGLKLYLDDILLLCLLFFLYQEGVKDDELFLSLVLLLLS